MIKIRSLINCVVPGFNTLEYKAQQDFLNTRAGVAIKQMCNQWLIGYTADLRSLNSNFWYYLVSFGWTNVQNKRFKALTCQWLKAYQHDPDYQSLREKIIFKVLVAQYPELCSVNPDIQRLLVKANEPNQLNCIACINAKNHLIKLAETNLDEKENTTLYLGLLTTNFSAELEIDKEKILDDWFQTFNQNESLVSQANVIFNHVKDKRILTNIIFNILENNADKAAFNTLNQQQFKAINQQQASLLAMTIIMQSFDINHLQFNDYKCQITNEITEQLMYINNFHWDHLIDCLATINGSLSYLYHCKLIDRGLRLLDALADAHAFIQATGFATQNESSFLSLVDMYNYKRSYKHIAEVKSITKQLFSFIWPLYEEYKDIARREKNKYWKIFRILMPLLIIAAVVVVVACILAPLALPELAFTIVLIPTLVLAVAVASGYVSLKSDIYHRIRAWWYGGAFNTPEFKITPRFIAALDGNQALALKIQDFYIENIKKCSIFEKNMQELEKKGLLLTNDTLAREKNLEQLQAMLLYIYDFYHNTKLPYDQIKTLLCYRLRQYSQDRYQELTSQIVLDKKPIEQVVDNAIDHSIEQIKTKLSIPCTLSSNRYSLLNINSYLQRQHLLSTDALNKELSRTDHLMLNPQSQ